VLKVLDAVGGNWKYKIDKNMKVMRRKKQLEVI
jgi:hypothetical protein